jgi:hypothetical protein
MRLLARHHCPGPLTLALSPWGRGDNSDSTAAALPAPRPAGERVAEGRVRGSTRPGRDSLAEGRARTKTARSPAQRHRLGPLTLALSPWGRGDNSDCTEAPLHSPRPIGERVAEGRVRGQTTVAPFHSPRPSGERVAEGRVRGGTRPGLDSLAEARGTTKTARIPAQRHRPGPLTLALSPWGRGDNSDCTEAPLHSPRPTGERVAEGRVRGQTTAASLHSPRPNGERVAEGRVRGQTTPARSESLPNQNRPEPHRPRATKIHNLTDLVSQSLGPEYPSCASENPVRHSFMEM